MRASRVLARVSILALLLTACRETRLEHFKFYALTPRPIGQTERILLKGQLDATPALARITAMTHFGNPVHKMRTTLTATPTPSDEPPPEAPGDEEAPPPTPTFAPLENPKHHLTWYKLDETGKTYYVQVEDQFGIKDLLIGDPVALLVPARKHEVGPDQPKGLNHFKCYDILRHRGADPEPVVLQDQFDLPSVDLNVATTPEFLCVPVEKRRGRERKKRERNSGNDHLLIYLLENRRDYDRRKTVTDQISANTLLVGFRSFYLAVPAHKGVPRTATELPPPPTRTPTPG